MKNKEEKTWEVWVRFVYVGKNARILPWLAIFDLCVFDETRDGQSRCTPNPRRYMMWSVDEEMDADAEYVAPKTNYRKQVVLVVTSVSSRITTTQKIHPRNTAAGRSPGGSGETHASSMTENPCPGLPSLRRASEPALRTNTPSIQNKASQTSTDVRQWRSAALGQKYSVRQPKHSRTIRYENQISHGHLGEASSKNEHFSARRCPHCFHI